MTTNNWHVPLEKFSDEQLEDDLIRNKVIVVWFSCGAASAIAAKKTIEIYGKYNTIRIVNNPVLEEDEDNRRFLKDVENWLGYEIDEATNPEFPSKSCVDVWEKRRFMSSPYGAPCTKELKKRARQIWESENHHDYLVMGFTSDEIKRHEMFKLTERSNILPVLINLEISKTKCFELLLNAGISLPRIYRQGYPNANCKGCVKATSPTYWNHVRKVDPDVFDARAKQSREIGARLVRYKGERVFLDELPEDATGRPMKSLQFDCGIFCEEYREVTNEQ